jgi:hypothetical protein
MRGEPFSQRVGGPTSKAEEVAATLMAVHAPEDRAMVRQKAEQETKEAARQQSFYALRIEQAQYWYPSPARARPDPADEQPARTYPVRSATKTRAIGKFPGGKVNAEAGCDGLLRCGRHKPGQVAVARSRVSRGNESSGLELPQKIRLRRGGLSTTAPDLCFKKCASNPGYCPCILLPESSATEHTGRFDGFPPSYGSPLLSIFWNLCVRQTNGTHRGGTHQPANIF